jgi:hypothetical protein
MPAFSTKTWRFCSAQAEAFIIVCTSCARFVSLKQQLTIALMIQPSWSVHQQEMTFLSMRASMAACQQPPTCDVHSMLLPHSDEHDHFRHGPNPLAVFQLLHLMQMHWNSSHLLHSGLRCCSSSCNAACHAAKLFDAFFVVNGKQHQDEPQFGMRHAGAWFVLNANHTNPGLCTFPNRSHHDVCSVHWPAQCEQPCYACGFSVELLRHCPWQQLHGAVQPWLRRSSFHKLGIYLQCWFLERTRCKWN